MPVEREQELAVLRVPDARRTILAAAGQQIAGLIEANDSYPAIVAMECAGALLALDIPEQ